MPGTMELSITIPQELYDAIKAEADRQGQTLAALTRSILWDWQTKKGGQSGTSGQDQLSQ